MKYKIMKVMSFMSIPYLLPIDITIAVISKVWRNLPAIKSHLKKSLYDLLVFLHSVVNKMESKRHLYSAKFSCQLAVTEYDYTNESSPQVYTEVPVRKVSSVKLPKRKLTETNNTNNPVNPIPSPKKIVEKSNSFTVGSSASRKRSHITFKEPQPLPDKEEIKLKAKERLERLQQQSKVKQRKSYAGSHDLIESRSFDSAIDRRRSMIDLSTKVIAPERVISKVNFGFSFDLKSKSNEDLSMTPQLDTPTIEENEPMFDALKVLQDVDQTNAVEIANKALEWERECLQKYKEFGEIDPADVDGTNINKMIELTKRQDALMTFYYTGEDNHIKVTEIFNLPEDEAREKVEVSDAVPKHQNVDDEEDGLRSMTPKKSSLKSKVSPISVPPNERRRKKSVIFVE